VVACQAAVSLLTTTSSYTQRCLMPRGQCHLSFVTEDAVFVLSATCMPVNARRQRRRQPGTHQVPTGGACTAVAYSRPLHVSAAHATCSLTLSSFEEKECMLCGHVSLPYHGNFFDSRQSQHLAAASALSSTFAAVAIACRTRSHPEMVGDMSRVISNFDL